MIVVLPVPELPMSRRLPYFSPWRCLKIATDTYRRDSSWPMTCWDNTLKISTGFMDMDRSSASCDSFYGWEGAGVATPGSYPKAIRGPGIPGSPAGVRESRRRAIMSLLRRSEGDYARADNPR